jgi:hypothetical protein
MDRIYHITREGRNARARRGSALPPAILHLLCEIGHATAFGDIAARLARYDEQHIFARLEDLEAIGLVESIGPEWLEALLELAAAAERPVKVLHQES